MRPKATPQAFMSPRLGAADIRGLRPSCFRPKPLGCSPLYYKHYGTTYYSPSFSPFYLQSFSDLMVPPYYNPE